MTQLGDAALWALVHFEAMDRANAAMHCAEVRYSPITFRLADALDDAGGPYDDLPVVRDVLAHRGDYELDPGR